VIPSGRVIGILDLSEYLVNQDSRVVRDGCTFPYDRLACMIAALMLLAPGNALRPHDIIRREVDWIDAVQNNVEAA
jgi:hypothetical protein